MPMLRQLPASWEMVNSFVIAARARTCTLSMPRPQRHLLNIYRLHERLRSLQAPLA